MLKIVVSVFADFFSETYFGIFHTVKYCALYFEHNRIVFNGKGSPVVAVVVVIKLLAHISPITVFNISSATRLLELPSRLSKNFVLNAPTFS